MMVFGTCIECGGTPCDDAIRLCDLCLQQGASDNPYVTDSDDDEDGN